MVCTVLCLYKRVCVCVWTYTDQHYAHSITLQIYDTLQNSVAWASEHEHRTSLPYFKASSLRILMPDPRPFKTHSNSFPLTFAWLTSCTSTHAEKYFSNSFCHHSFFSHHILEFSPITVAIIPFFVILWHICSKQPLHFSKSFTFPKCCCYFLPSKWQNLKTNKQKTYSTA